MAHPGTSTLLRWTIAFIAFGSLTAMVHAQSLAQQDLLPAIGSAWHMRALQVVPPEQLLTEPITWPFEDLVGNDVFGATYTVLDPTSVPGNSAFADADIALRKVPDNDPAPTHTFYDVQDESALELGSLGPVISAFFRPSSMAFAYPLEVGDVKHDDFCFLSQSSGGNADYCGTTHISLDAIGTLELPFDTYVNVQLVTTRRATALLGMTDSTISVTKDWYAPGIPYPLLHVVSVTNSDGSTSRNGQIVDEASLVGIAESARGERPQLFPNPTNGAITLVSAEPGVIEVRASDGRLVKTQKAIPTQERITIDLGDLPNGIYNVAMSGNNVRRSTMVVVAR